MAEVPPVVINVTAELDEPALVKLREQIRSALATGKTTILPSEMSDADTLDSAAAILRERASRCSFQLDVLCRVLTRTAARIRSEQ